MSEGQVEESVAVRLRREVGSPPVDWRFVLDSVPLPVLVADDGGWVLFANTAAAGVLGSGPDGLSGRSVASVLGSGRGPGPHATGPGGEQLWLLGDRPRGGASAGELARARFAVEVADALAGTLNLRRTLARVAHLAVPALGGWAAVSVQDGREMRTVVRGPGAAEVEYHMPSQRLGPAPLEAITRMPAGEVVADAAVLGGYGIPPDVAGRLLAAGSSRVKVAPLRSHGSLLGILVVGGAPAGVAVGDGIEILAGRASVAISAAKVYDDRSALAATLRASLVPAPLPTTPGLRLGAAYRPAEQASQIGGDFYDFQRDGPGWSLSVGDVCGKGVEAAVLTGQVRQSLRTVVPLAAGPAERLRLLNAAMVESDGRSYVTVAHALLHPCQDGVTVRLACGGHPAPLLRRADGCVETLASSGTLIGMMQSVRFEEVAFVLAPGDTLVCYTDGLSEARGAHDRFGAERIAAVLADSSGMTSQAIAERLLRHGLDYSTGGPRDDLAVVCVQPEP